MLKERFGISAIKRHFAVTKERSNLLDNIHPPFNKSGLIMAFEHLTSKIKPYLTDYDTLLGDDVSGRLPTLVFADLVSRKRLQVGLPRPRVYFLNAGSSLYHKETLNQFSELLQKREREISKILFITEYISSGTSVSIVLSKLRKNNLSVNVATLSISKDPHRLKGVPEKVFSGDSILNAGEFFFRMSELTGLLSTRLSIVAEPNRNPDTRARAYMARKDMKLISDYLWRQIVNKE